MRILVLEDDPDHRMFIERALRKRGFDQLCLTADVNSALEVTHADPCDIAILDSGVMANEHPSALAALRAACKQGAFVIGFSAGHPETEWADLHLLKTGPEAFEELADHVVNQTQRVP